MNWTKLLGLPELASEHGKALDELTGYVHLLMLVLFVGWLIYFIAAVVKFRKSSNPKADYVGVKSHMSTYLEIGVAVVEELVFRGFVFQRLVAGIGTWPAQIAMAAYFVLTHSQGLAASGDVQPIAMLNIFLAGLMFGAAQLRTRALALTIALHFALNFTQGPLLGFGVSGNAESGLLQPNLDDAPTWWTGGSFGLEASVPGTVLILLALILLLRRAANAPPATRA